MGTGRMVASDVCILGTGYIYQETVAWLWRPSVEGFVCLLVEQFVLVKGQILDLDLPGEARRLCSHKSQHITTQGDRE